jgi:predicted small secreted protein
MMKRRYHFGMVLSLVLLLAVALAGCGGNGGNGGGSDAKTADPYPSQSVSDIEQWGSNQTFQPPNNETEYNTFLNYLADITGISNGNNWPESVKNAASYLAQATIFGGHLLVSPCEYKTVSNMVFFEYTNWYQPNSILNVTLSSINETSVTNSITTSVGLVLGNGNVGSFSASISKESSKTVTTSKGISVGTTYDLTQYDQSKMYKAVLVGKYAYVRYHFRIQGANPSTLPPMWNTDGNGYIGYFDGIKVHQDTLAVKLVHN